MEKCITYLVKMGGLTPALPANSTANTSHKV